MIFVNLDEVLLDRVGHAAKVFGFTLPSYGVFGVRELVRSLNMSATGFYGILEVATPAWKESPPQPWAARLLRQLRNTDADFRLLARYRSERELSSYSEWVSRQLGPSLLTRLVLCSNDLPAPMGAGDLLVDALEANGRLWQERNGRFLKWTPYAPGDHQSDMQWLQVISQIHLQSRAS